MLVFSLSEALPAIYAERFVSGLFAAAVTPVASATVGDLALTEEVRARRLTFVSLAGVSGLLLGPMLGLLIARLSGLLLQAPAGPGALAAPLTGAAMLAFLAAAVAASTIAVGRRAGTSRTILPAAAAGNPSVVRKLLALAFIVSAGIGVFEVSLALRGKQELSLTQYQIALMFTECSLVMVAVQAIVFSPWIKPEATRRLLLPALVVFAAGLFLAPRVTEFTAMLTIVAVVAASAGILSPVLTYWISRNAGRTQGMQLGKQSAATALGTATGSTAGGLLFGLASVPDAAFLLTTAAVAFGILLGVGLPSQLMSPRLEAGACLGSASTVASDATNEGE
jgi:MFS family permease